MRTKYLVPEQVPEFVRHEHPAFVQFLQAYYEWQDQYGVVPSRDLKSHLDVTTTVDDFLKYFRKSIDVYKLTVNDPSRMLLRHTKDIYTSKGTENAIQAVLQSLYNKQATVKQPWDDVFKISDGKWTQDIGVMVRVTKGDAQNLNGQFIHLIDEHGTTQTTVVRAVTQREGSNVYELLIDRFQTSTTHFEYVESLDGTIKGSVYKTPITVQVMVPGVNFEVGMVFAVEGSNGSRSTMKVKRVGTQGQLEALELISFGYGFEVDFMIGIASPNTSGGLASQIQTTLSSTGETVITPTNDNVAVYQESGQIVQHNYVDLSNDPYMPATYVGQLVAVITPQIGTARSTLAQMAYVRLKLGTIFRYPGYYSKSDSIIGDQIYLQDSSFYQVYAYETVVEETIDKYGELLKRTLHPAGTRHFANFLVSETMSLSASAVVEFNLIAKADPVIDFAIMADRIQRFDAHANLPRVFNEEEQVDYAGSEYAYLDGGTDPLTGLRIPTKVHVDFVKGTFLEVIDLNGGTNTQTGLRIPGLVVMDMHKPLADAVYFAEDLTYVQGKIFEEVINLSENIVKRVHKYTDDDPTYVSMSGLISVNPYVWEASAGQYWYANYIENDAELN